MWNFNCFFLVLFVFVEIKNIERGGGGGGGGGVL